MSFPTSLLGSVDLLAAFNLGDQANVHITAGMCGKVPTDDEVSGKQPIQDEFRPGYLVRKEIGMKKLLGDLLVNTGMHH